MAHLRHPAVRLVLSGGRLSRGVCPERNSRPRDRVPAMGEPSGGGGGRFRVSCHARFGRPGSESIETSFVAALPLVTRPIRTVARSPVSPSWSPLASFTVCRPAELLPPAESMPKTMADSRTRFRAPISRIARVSSRRRERAHAPSNGWRFPSPLGAKHSPLAFVSHCATGFY